MAASSSTTPTEAAVKVKEPLYISFDIEADGDSPAHNSMLSFGAVGFDRTGKEVFAMQMNLKPRAGTSPDARCVREFWDKHPEVWKFVNENQQESQAFTQAIAAMWTEYSKEWNIRWVANPSAYDWQWLNHYYNLHKTAEMPNIGYTARCTGSMLHAYALVKGWTSDQEDEFEEDQTMRLRAPSHIAHNPEHDARVQGRFFIELRNELMAW